MPDEEEVGDSVNLIDDIDELETRPGSLNGNQEPIPGSSQAGQEYREVLHLRKHHQVLLWYIGSDRNSVLETPEWLGNKARRSISTSKPFGRSHHRFPSHLSWREKIILKVFSLEIGLKNLIKSTH